MKHFWCLIFLFFAPLYFLNALNAQSQDQTALPGAASSGGGTMAFPSLGNVLNPNISAIGWFQGLAGNTPNALDENPAFKLHEIELGFQSVVDPYSRADIFVSINDEGKVDLEEGYLTALALPFGFQAKLGKFQPDLGKFNRTHTPETDFADRPLAPRRFFGDEPLKAIGGGISHLIPNPWDLYVNLDAQVSNTPDASDVPAFAKANRGDLLYVGRLSGFADLTESSNLMLGVSYGNGANGFGVSPVDGSTMTRRSQAGVVDLTFRWKNPRRSIYSSFMWQNEYYVVKKEMTPDSNIARNGAFSHVRWQFARRWHAGLRADWTQLLDANNAADMGGLIYLTFYPSEFSLISIQGKHVKFAGGSVEDIGFLKLTFNIGPHGAHPF